MSDKTWSDAAVEAALDAMFPEGDWRDGYGLPGRESMRAALTAAQAQQDKEHPNG